MQQKFYRLIQGSNFIGLCRYLMAYALGPIMAFLQDILSNALLPYKTIVYYLPNFTCENCFVMHSC